MTCSSISGAWSPVWDCRTAPGSWRPLGKTTPPVRTGAPDHRRSRTLSRWGERWIRRNYRPGLQKPRDVGIPAGSDICWTFFWSNGKVVCKYDRNCQQSLDSRDIPGFRKTFSDSFLWLSSGNIETNLHCVGAEYPGADPGKVAGLRDHGHGAGAGGGGEGDSQRDV